MRLVVARCQVDYAGRLTAHLPMATRVLMIKADGSVLVHSDGGSYKPLNWMSPPCALREGTTEDGQVGEFPTAIGPVDLMCRDAEGLSVAVEIKRRGEIDGVEQLTRYLELLNRDPLLTGKGSVRGIFAAQAIKPQARVLAEDRGITCAVVDYDALRGMDDDAEHRLF